jgi:hypothetical protein
MGIGVGGANWLFALGAALQTLVMASLKLCLGRRGEGRIGGDGATRSSGPNPRFRLSADCTSEDAVADNGLRMDSMSDGKGSRGALRYRPRQFSGPVVGLSRTSLRDSQRDWRRSAGHWQLSGHSRCRAATYRCASVVTRKGHPNCQRRQ